MTKIEWLIVVAIVGILITFTFIPYQEMKTFNKFSKTKATFWDAVFSDLRIIPDK